MADGKITTQNSTPSVYLEEKISGLNDIAEKSKEIIEAKTELAFAMRDEYLGLKDSISTYGNVFRGLFHLDPSEADRAKIYRMGDLIQKMEKLEEIINLHQNKTLRVQGAINCLTNARESGKIPDAVEGINILITQCLTQK